jgi:uncharacterized membrane protein/protein-disulfide isomerase
MPESAGASVPARIRLAQFLLLGALAISLFLLYTSLKGGGIPGCGPESGCSDVLNSRWSKVGAIPVSGLAAALYVGTLLGSWKGLRKPGEQKAVFAAGCVIITAAIWFIALQLFVLHHVCWFCMSAHLLGSVASLLLISGLLARQGHADLMPSLSLGISAVLVLIMLQVAIQPKTNIVRKFEAAAPAPPAPTLSQSTQSIVQPTVPVSGPVATASPPPALTQVANSAPVTPKLQSLAKIESPNLQPAQAFFPILNGQFQLNLSELPIVGPRNAPHTIVGLFDYTCKHCRQTHAILHEVMEQVTNLNVVPLPVPLDSNCNRTVRRTPPAHVNACEYARLALAVWRAMPALYPKFDTWIFSGGEKPPPIEQARQYAAELIGSQKLTTALEDPWITDRIQKDVQIYETNSRAARNGSIPQLIFPTGVLVGPFRDLDNAYENLRQFFGITNAPPQARAGG